MSHPARLVWKVALAAVAGILFIGPTQAAGAGTSNYSGIVVTEVGRGKAGERSGVREGDVLLAWSWKAQAAGKEPKSGAFRAPMELAALESSLAAEGRVTVKGTRRGKPFEAALADGEWALTTRPNFSGADLKAYEQALGPTSGGPGETAALLRLSDSVAKRGGWAESVWIRLRAAEALARAKKVEESGSALQKAIAGATGKLPTESYAELLVEAAALRLGMGDSEGARGLSRQAVELWKKASPGAGYGGALFHPAEVSFRKGDLDAALGGFRNSLSVLEKVAPESYLAARSTSRIGEVLWTKGRLEEAQEYFQRAYDLMEKLTPGGAELVGFANNLGKVRFRRGDTLGAEKIYRQSVDLLEKNEPGTLELARSLNGLGLIVTDLGDYPEAERLLSKAVEIWKKEAPGNPNGWRPYGNLGNVYLHRGDLAKADACYSAVLEMVRKIAPGSLQETAPLGNLAAVSQRRRDYDTAESLLLRVLEITEKQAPGSSDLARCHEYLGALDAERGRPEDAMGHYRKAVEILRAQSPGSVQLGRSLRTFGSTYLKERRPAEAEPLLAESLAILEAVNPASDDTGASLTYLGMVAMSRKDYAVALGRLDHAVRILDRGGAPTEHLAQARHYRGLALWASGRKEEAKSALLGAVEAVESLGGRLGGSSQDKATFLEGYADYYLQLEDLLLEMGEGREAFRTAERWRATEFLRMLAERDLDFGGEVPPELERQRRLATAELERLWASSDAGAAPDSKEAAELEVRIRAAQKKLEDVRLATLSASRGVYDLRYPKALGAEEASAALEEGTLLLEYSVGPDRVLLFAIGPGRGEFSANVLPVRAGALSKDVERFRALVQSAASPSGGPSADEELRALASKLSETLLGPAEEQIVRARRLLVVPDSSLHYLPFAALADPAKSSGRGGGAKVPFRFLVESKPVHTAASATVYAQLLARRRSSGELTLQAFGDPDYGKGLPPGRWRGRELAPLPATRREVEAVRKAIGGGTVYLGAEATVSKAMGLPRDTRVVHFACHGFTDEVQPLESALALTPSGGSGAESDDGLLQAWEIYEKMRVDADLVALSACETGLGKVIGGEGLVGLTRAFQFAGARSVLASLWPVSDEGTAELMRCFYARLRSGAPKDEALREAQLQLLRGKEDGSGAGTKGPGTLSSPFHWAAFQLVGDWK